MGKFEQVVSVCVVVVVSPKPGLSLWLFKYSTGATELCVTHVKEGRGKQSWSQAFNTTACNMSKIKWESSMSVLIHICIRHTQQDGGGGKNSTLSDMPYASSVCQEGNNTILFSMLQVCMEHELLVFVGIFDGRKCHPIRCPS